MRDGLNPERCARELLEEIERHEEEIRVVGVEYEAYKHACACAVVLCWPVSNKSDARVDAGKSRLGACFAVGECESASWRSRGRSNRSAWSRRKHWSRWGTLLNVSAQFNDADVFEPQVHGIFLPNTIARGTAVGPTWTVPPTTTNSPRRRSG